MHEALHTRVDVNWFFVSRKEDEGMLALRIVWIQQFKTQRIYKTEQWKIDYSCQEELYQ